MTTDLPDHARSPRAWRILVVDDEPLIRDLLTEILQRAGHQVDTACDGAQACQQVRGERYDLVITDVGMPRMSGIDFYRKLVELRPEMEGRIIFATGNLIDDETRVFISSVKARALTKPLGLAQVIQAVDETLG